jgi:uncharacterized circularly permuted ATP-grasp superfamily protein
MEIASGYNEAFDETGGMRAPYRAFRRRTGRDPFDPSPSSVAALSRQPLGDRYSILPIPLILDDSEYRESIARGVRQRALALQSLFWDIVCSRETPLPAGIIARILEQERTSVDELAGWWKDKSRGNVRFTYAPDLVRDADGRWCILEDNVGCVGGVVDSRLVVERFLVHTGTTLDSRIAVRADLVHAVHTFLADVGRTVASPDVLAIPGPECDPEARRKREVLGAAGLRLLDGVESSRDVRAVVNFETTELTRELFGSGGAAVMTAPGIDILGNKLLLPFMDAIVSSYCGAEPVLRTAQTELYEGFPADPSGWILKKSNGCQGKEVFFLGELSDAERRRLETTVAATWGGPEWAVLQRRVSASFLPVSPAAAWHRFQVELRPIGFVIGDGTCIVSDHASGRAFSNLSGRSLGNMSQGAHYIAVLREPPD